MTGKQTALKWSFSKDKGRADGFVDNGEPLSHNPIAPTTTSEKSKQLKDIINKNLFSRSLRCIMENHAHRVAVTLAQFADTMPHINAVIAFRTLVRPLMDGKGHGIAFRSGTTSGRVCMRGRCSVSTNSPPSKSLPGSDSTNAACMGNTYSP
jgi:hypothetical protein